MHVKKFVSDSTALLSLEIIGRFLPLVTFPLVARALGPETFGKLGFSGAVIGFFGLLAAPGFASFGTREIARRPDDSRQIAATIVGARLLLSVAAYALLVLYTFTLAPHDAATRMLILLTGLGMLIGSVDVGWVFAGHSRMWVLSLPGICWQVGAALLTVLFVRRPGDAGLMLALGSAMSFSAVAYLYGRARRDYQLGFPSLRFSALRRILPTCFTLGLSGLFVTIYCQIDSVMIGYMRTTEELGLYTAAIRVVSIGLVLFSVLSPVFYPALSAAVAKGDTETERMLARRFGSMAVLLALPMATVMWLLAAPVAKLFLTGSYSDAVPLVRWLAPVVLWSPIAVYCTSRLIPHGRERKHLLCVGVGAVLNVVLNAIFIPRYGACAATLATGASEVSVALLGCYFSRDLVKPRLGVFVWMAGAATLAMVGAIFLLNQFSPGQHVLAIIACAGLVYAGACLLIKILIERLSVRSPMRLAHAS